MVGFKYDKNTILNSKSELPSEFRNHAYCKMTLVGSRGRDSLLYYSMADRSVEGGAGTDVLFSPSPQVPNGSEIEIFDFPSTDDALSRSTFW